MSSLLFNSVLQCAMEGDLKLCREKEMGIKLGHGQGYCISNLRFANDMLLLSTSLNQLKKIMTDFKRSTDKTVAEDPPASRHHHSGETSPKRKSEVSGRTITFDQQETVEIKRRIRAAWSSFARR